MAGLEHELRTVRAELQATIRTLEIANEEALSATEEVQSANEELMSSKEELQALNEELMALNSQLQETLERHRGAASDLQSILYSTDVATLVLDTQLNIRFFTPSVKALFSVIPGDVGRPLTDLRSLEAGNTLTAEVLGVLRTAEPCERDIVTQDGSWFSRRILPYRTLGHKVQGVVITFTEITARKTGKTQTEAACALAEAAREAKSRFLAAASHDLRQPLQTLALVQGMLAKLMPGEQAQHLLRLLEQSSDTIAGVLNKLLDIDQLDPAGFRQQNGPRPGDLVAAAIVHPPAEPAVAVAKPAGAAAARTIFLVDDDAGIRAVMGAVFLEHGWVVREYSSSEEFLTAYHAVPGAGESCLLVDAYLPGISGLELLQSLHETGNHLPSIMITGRGDVQMAVKAMRAGALDFIEKPVSYDELLSRVSRALAQSPDPAKRSAWQENAASNVARLTVRQRQIMELVIAGHPSKNIANDLGISQRTVENHRAAIMKKTESRSLPALAKVAFGAGMKEARGF
jgi:FixJ family two-component response regulator/PAS domain-containing protein